MTYPLNDKAVDDFANAMHETLMSMPDDDRFKKAKQAFLDNIWQDMEYSIIDNMSETVADFVRSMSAKVVGEILEGREDQMRRYLNLDGYTGRDMEHKVIHGTLFETGAIALRKKMAQQHADLIQNERITDLEDQVKSLVSQVNERDIQIEAMRKERMAHI